MALPLVGVGLLYRNGYFRQTIDADGHQEHRYPDYDLARMPLTRALGREGNPLTVSVELPERERAGRRLDRPGRSRPGAPARHRQPDQRPGRPTDHAHPVRPRARDAAAPGADPRRRRRSSAAGARDQARRLAPQRGPLGVPARGAGSRADRRRRRRSTRRSRPWRATACSRSTRRSRPATSGSTPTSSGASPGRSSTATGDANTGGVPVERVLEIGRGTDGDPDQFDMTAFSLRLTNGANAVSKLHAATANSTWQRASSPHEILGDHERRPPADLGRRPGPRACSSATSTPTSTTSTAATPATRWWERIDRIPATELWEAHLDQKRELARVRARPAADPVRPARRGAADARRSSARRSTRRSSRSASRAGSRRTSAPG